MNSTRFPPSGEDIHDRIALASRRFRRRRRVVLLKRGVSRASMREREKMRWWRQ
jgi:hypothetical protein